MMPSDAVTAKVIVVVGPMSAAGIANCNMDLHSLLYTQDGNSNIR